MIMDAYFAIALLLCAIIIALIGARSWRRKRWLAVVSITSTALLLVGVLALALREPRLATDDFDTPHQGAADTITWPKNAELHVTCRLIGTARAPGPLLNFLRADAGYSGVAISLADDAGPIRATKIVDISKHGLRKDGGYVLDYHRSLFGGNWYEVPRINHAAHGTVIQATKDSLEIVIGFLNTVGTITDTGGTRTIVWGGWGTKTCVDLRLTRTGPNRYIVRPTPNQAAGGTGISQTPGELFGFNHRESIDLFESIWGWELVTPQKINHD